MKKYLSRIDKQADYPSDGIVFRVLITDVKERYGHILYQIEPLEGTGSKWVREESLEGFEA